VAAALSAWLVPGLGHILLGERRRGTILMLTLMLLWLAGLVIGGIGVIDHEQKWWWFCGQMLAAPSVLVDWLRPMVSDVEASLGRVAEQGTLYVTLAGLLNLVAILDVLYRDPNDPRDRADDEASQAPDKPAATGDESADAAHSPEGGNA
jgi:hypothetical protein